MWLYLVIVGVSLNVVGVYGQTYEYILFETIGFTNKSYIVNGAIPIVQNIQISKFERIQFWYH